MLVAADAVGGAPLTITRWRKSTLFLANLV